MVPPQADDHDLARIRPIIWDSADVDVVEPFGAYVYAFDEPGASIARELEQQVFLEAFGNTAEQLAAEYGPYESSSLFFCVIDHRRATIAGMMRMILPTPHGPGLKSLADLEPAWGTSASDLLAQAGLDLEIERTWDIATLAVAHEYRSAASAGLVSLGLFQSFVLTAHSAGINSFVMILDHIVFRMLRLRVRVPFIALAESRPYLGSPASIPSFLLLDQWRERLRQGSPELLDVIFEGRGIGPALRRIDIERAASRVMKSMTSGG